MKTGELIHQNLSDPRCVFVFPAEITARFWLKKSFSFAPTLDARRFISWDQFKEAAFHYEAAGRPVTPSIRALFISGFLEQNRRERLLRQIIPAHHADNSAAFQQSLERILPTLHRLRGISSLADGKDKDLQLLLREYTAMLARENLFEPAFNHPGFRADGHRYLIFFPEVIQDYSLYTGLLSREAAVETISPPPRGSDTALLAFDTSDEETRWVLLKIGGLLDQGVDPEEIVISSASLETLEAPLRRDSLLYEVPLRIHGGRTLAGYPEARFFKSLADCAASAFGLEALKSLLLDHALPWRERGLARRLVRFGIDFRLISSAGEHDIWQSAFRRAVKSGMPPGPGELTALRAFYIRLRAASLRIFRAESFARLKEAVAAFTSVFFAPAEWSLAGKSRFEYALRGLDELIEAEAHLPGCSRPFALWYDRLKQRPYVARESGGGIAVYPYRVASGIFPDYHFIINASQQGTRHVVKRFPFLSLDEEEELQGAEQDFSARHIDLYAASGRTVSFSYARKGVESSQLPPASFVIRGRIVAAAAEQQLLAADPYAQERLAWAGAEVPGALFHLQQQGFTAADRSVLLASPQDYAGGRPADPALADLLAGEMSDPEGFLSITPTALESFQACPFRFLLQRGAGIEEQDFQPPLFSPLEIGELMHRVFQLFNEELMRRTLELREENLPLFADLLSEALRAAADSQARLRPVPPRPIWTLLLNRIEKLVRRAVELECRSRPAQTLLFAEHRLRLRRPQEQVALSGKIDRISTHAENMVLLDYKKKRLPSAPEIFGDDPVSFQMPFYIHLMNENDLPISESLYYSLEKGCFKTVWNRQGTGMTDSEGLEAGIALLLERIDAMAHGIRGGAYPAARDPARGGCSGCGFRGVCRARYALRAMRAMGARESRRETS